MDFRTLVAKNLNELVTKSGKTQVEIAFELDVDQPVISQYIHGVAVPTAENVKKLCIILDCDYADILGKLD